MNNMNNKGKQFCGICLNWHSNLCFSRDNISEEREKEGENEKEKEEEKEKEKEIQIEYHNNWCCIQTDDICEVINDLTDSDSSQEEAGVVEDMYSDRRDAYQKKRTEECIFNNRIEDDVSRTSDAFIDCEIYVCGACDGSHVCPAIGVANCVYCYYTLTSCDGVGDYCDDYCRQMYNDNKTMAGIGGVVGIDCDRCGSWHKEDEFRYCDEMHTLRMSMEFSCVMDESQEQSQKQEEGQQGQEEQEDEINASLLCSNCHTLLQLGSSGFCNSRCEKMWANMD